LKHWRNTAVLQKTSETSKLRRPTHEREDHLGSIVKVAARGGKDKSRRLRANSRELLEPRHQRKETQQVRICTAIQSREQEATPIGQPSPKKTKPKGCPKFSRLQREKRMQPLEGKKLRLGGKESPTGPQQGVTPRGAKDEESNAEKKETRRQFAEVSKNINEESLRGEQGGRKRR